MDEFLAASHSRAGGQGGREDREARVKGCAGEHSPKPTGGTSPRFCSAHQERSHLSSVVFSQM